jgi:hypothetical protein
LIDCHRLAATDFGEIVVCACEDAVAVVDGDFMHRTRLGNDRFWTVGVRMGVERPVNYLLKEKALN